MRYMTWLFAALGSIACFGLYYVQSFQSINIKLSDHMLATSVDSIITDLSVQQFNTEGKLIHFLHTPLMQHIPKNNTNVLQTPHIIVSQRDQAPWEINAEEGTALHGGKQITFRNRVTVQQKKHQQTEETTLTTDEITYFPKDKLATTLKDVTLQQAHNIIQSTGMNAYLAESRVQLLNNTRGHYEPHQEG